MKRLLESGTGVPPVGSVTGPDHGRDACATPKPAAPRTWLKIVAPLAGMIFGLPYAFRPQAWRERPEQPKPAVASASAAAWPPDPDLTRAMALVNATETNSGDFALAEEIVQKTLAKNSTDPEAVTVMARVQVSFLYWGFDLSEEPEMSAVESKAFTPSNASRGR